MAIDPTDLEVERKFVLDETAAVDLSLVEGASSIDEHPPLALCAVYYDTPDLSLTRLGVTLRRREGGTDDGWTLKVPSRKDARTELSRPLDAPGTPVPDDLRDQLLGLTRGATLTPLVELRTSRHEHHVVGSDGHGLAVVAFDEVTAQPLRPTPPPSTSWTEVEVELVDGSEELLDSITDSLRAHGAAPAPWTSKLDRALGQTGPLPRRERPRTAGEVALVALREKFDELQAGDLAVRSAHDDAVHKMRVATRRLRSDLATFKPYLATNRWSAVRDELAWIGGLLGAVRDLDVLEERILDQIDHLDSLLVVGPVRARVHLELHARRSEALEALHEALRSNRHLHLLAELDDLLSEPPLGHAAEKKPAHAIGRVLKAAERVRKAARHADRAVDPSEHDRRLHEVRKAAKRSRYAAEALASLDDKPARKLAKEMKRTQEILGEHQDAVTARPVLRDLAMKAYLASENAFTFGLLAGLEQGRADRARERYEAKRAGRRTRA